jgi:phosphate/sulfate permease
MQDAANISIFLPRSLSFEKFLFFTGYIFLGLGILFYLRGDKIQEIVTEKTTVEDVRNATIIDLVYTLILLIFQWASKIPMSTTWVFLGLMGGREIAIALGKYCSCPCQTGPLSQLSFHV